MAGPLVRRPLGRRARSVVARDERLGHLGRGVAIDEEHRAATALDAGDRHLVALAPARARPSADALSAPASTSQMRSDELITGSVRLSRSGGGFGELRTAITVRSVTWMPERCGNSDAMCPSGPTPRNVMSKIGCASPSTP